MGPDLGEAWPTTDLGTPCTDKGLLCNQRGNGVSGRRSASPRHVRTKAATFPASGTWDSPGTGTGLGQRLEKNEEGGRPCRSGQDATGQGGCVLPARARVRAGRRNRQSRARGTRRPGARCARTPRARRRRRPRGREGGRMRAHRALAAAAAILFPRHNGGE